MRLLLRGDVGCGDGREHDSSTNALLEIDSGFTKHPSVADPRPDRLKNYRVNFAGLWI